jgi:hypothetical protein
MTRMNAIMSLLSKLNTPPVPLDVLEAIHLDDEGPYI